MANRRRSDRTVRDRAQDRTTASIGEPPAQTQEVRTISREEIERRAYDLYQQRGGGDGSDIEDWLQAERDLKQ